MNQSFPSPTSSPQSGAVITGPQVMAGLPAPQVPPSATTTGDLPTHEPARATVRRWAVYLGLILAVGVAITCLSGLALVSHGVVVATSAILIKGAPSNVGDTISILAIDGSHLPEPVIGTYPPAPEQNLRVFVPAGAYRILVRRGSEVIDDRQPIVIEDYRTYVYHTRDFIKSTSAPASP